MQTESVETTTPTIDKVKQYEMLKQKPKVTYQEREQKGKSQKRSALERKKNQFLNYATHLCRNNNQKEGVMSKRC